MHSLPVPPTSSHTHTHTHFSMNATSAALRSQSRGFFFIIALSNVHSGEHEHAVLVMSPFLMSQKGCGETGK